MAYAGCFFRNMAFCHEEEKRKLLDVLFVFRAPCANFASRNNKKRFSVTLINKKIDFHRFDNPLWKSNGRSGYQN